MLLGMVGKAGSGKDTVGDYLINNYNHRQISTQFNGLPIRWVWRVTTIISNSNDRLK
jgi:ABC-type dipeptide/oligopeptide/nickel transport system ATPase subunit